MMTRGRTHCLAVASLFDPELLAMYAALLAVLAAGGVIIYATLRWYRNLKNNPSTSKEDLAELAHALEDVDELAPEERERLRAALERQKHEADEHPKG
jgi:hypothetical protein